MGTLFVVRAFLNRLLRLICSSNKEFASGEVELPNDDPRTIERVLCFLCLQNYKEHGHILAIRRSTAEESPTGSPSQAQQRSADTLGQGIPGEQSADTGKQRAIAFNNLDVYIAADKFDIIPLKTLAAKRMALWMKVQWQSAAFLDMVQRVMESVPPHDLDLRNIVAKIISENIHALVQQTELYPLLEAFGGVGSSIIANLLEQNLIKRPDDDKKQEQANAQQQQQINTLQVLVNSAEALAQKLETIPRCTNCSKWFNVKVACWELKVGSFHCSHL